MVPIMEMSLQQSFKRFVHDDSGATVIEYALIAVAMAIAIIATFPSVANAVKGKFTSVAGYFALYS
jgi:pilus assembly protein Flp/PilA